MLVYLIRSFMKIVIAPNSFKGSFSSLEASSLIAGVIKEKRPNDETILVPLCDGGDGTMDVYSLLYGGKREEFPVWSLYSKNYKAPILFLNNEEALIEIAKVDGLNEKQKEPLRASSFGVGELILMALKRGAKKIILGLGGSGSTDGGAGMAMALGYTFLDEKGEKIFPSGENLLSISKIIAPSKPLPFSLKMLCDVKNPLFGKEGAAFVYGPQKGATLEICSFLDLGLKHLSSFFDNADPSQEGMGAAGGIGFGGRAFFSGEIVSGAEEVLNSKSVEKAFAGSNIIITGEGEVDETSFSGKSLGALLKRRGKAQVYLITGKSRLSPKRLSELGIARIAYTKLYEEDKGLAKTKESFLEAVSSLLR